MWFNILYRYEYCTVRAKKQRPTCTVLVQYRYSYSTVLYLELHYEYKGYTVPYSTQDSGLMQDAAFSTLLFPSYEHALNVCNLRWSVGLRLVTRGFAPPPSRVRNAFWCAMSYGKPFIVSADALWIRTPLLQGCPA